MHVELFYKHERNVTGQAGEGLRGRRQERIKFGFNDARAFQTVKRRIDI